MTVHNDQ